MVSAVMTSLTDREGGGVSICLDAQCKPNIKKDVSLTPPKYQPPIQNKIALIFRILSLITKTQYLQPIITQKTYRIPQKTNTTQTRQQIQSHNHPIL